MSTLLLLRLGSGVRAPVWRAGRKVSVCRRCWAGGSWSWGGLHVTWVGAASSRSSLVRLRALIPAGGAVATLLARGRGWEVAFCKRRPEAQTSRLPGAERNGGVVKATFDWGQFCQLLLPDLLLLALAVAVSEQGLTFHLPSPSTLLPPSLPASLPPSLPACRLLCVQQC